MDDFSKFTWIYLSKFKSDVEKVFHQFQTHVERLFHTKILSVQTDWGAEYQKLHHFFLKLGMAHRMSCPHTHQQNGIAERKHWHIVETGLAILAQSSLPIRFWDEAFLTVTFLINWLPSRVLDNTTPLDRLLKTDLDTLCSRCLDVRAGRILGHITLEN